MTQHQNQNETQPEHALLKGALAGFVATLPMTIFMLVTQRFLPKRQQYELPPEMITKDLAHRAHIRHHLNKQLILGATTASHFGYGAAMGAAYGPLQKRVPLPTIAQGVLYGLLVWAASYLGLLPLLGISASGHKEPVRRNLMMIAAHIVWGASLGAMARLLFREQG
jgi:uncharacterized membrane protein YagU involved in acid resistance